MGEPDISKLDEILDGVKIPPAPEILTNLNRELQRDEPELTRIAAIIQQDAALAGLVISTVNSPVFPLRNRVNSIPQAISLLGMAYTINIIMGLVLRQTFDARQDNPPRYWGSPTNIAMVMSSLSKNLIDVQPDEAYMLGLFHNAGHALICQRYEDYPEFYLENLNHPDKPVTEFEQQRYQFDHAVLGYYLARGWGLPEELCEVILRHHDVAELFEDRDRSSGERDVQRMLALLKLAEHIDTLYSGQQPDHEWERVGPPVLILLGLSEPDYQDIEADMLELLETEGQ